MNTVNIVKAEGSRKPQTCSKFANIFTKSVSWRTYQPHYSKTAQKKKPKALTVLKKEGGGTRRYEYAQRFNGVFFVWLALEIMIEKSDFL